MVNILICQLFLKWTLPSSKLEQFIIKGCFIVLLANSVDHYQTAPLEQSGLGLHCLLL